MTLGKPALIAAGTASALALGFSVFMSTERFRVERPNYLVVERARGFEVRRYAPRVVAYTVMRGPLETTQNEAFRRLARYIFGANQGGIRLSITPPLERAPTGTRIDMTSPVDVRRVDGGWRMEFTMPARFSLHSLPQPVDPEVKLEQLPGQTLATLRFTWRANPIRAARKMVALRRAVDDSSKWTAVGEPVLARYDGPGAIPFLRRNEVMLEVRRR